MVSCYLTFMTFLRAQLRNPISPIPLPTGMAGSVLLFDKVIPAVSGKSIYRKDLSYNAVNEKKKK